MKKNELKEVLPNFVEAVHTSEPDTIIMTITAFNPSENELMGAAIRYACTHGKAVAIIPMTDSNKK